MADDQKLLRILRLDGGEPKDCTPWAPQEIEGLIEVRPLAERLAKVLLN